MKSRFPKLLLVLAAFGFTAIPAFGGVAPNSGAQIYKSSVKAKSLRLDALATEKGTTSVSVYYILNRLEGQERTLVVNNKAKTYFLDLSGAATFGLGDEASQLFNIRTTDLVGNLGGTGSLIGKTKSHSIGEVEIDSYTPSLAYQFNSVTAPGGSLYLSVEEKAKLKIDKAAMKRAYANGLTTTDAALSSVIAFLTDKGYSPLVL